MRRNINRLRRLLRLPWRRKRLLVEAVFALALAWVVIHTLPYRRLARMFRQPVRRLEIQGESRVCRIEEVRWAVDAATRGLPWRMVCFPRALAAWWMLRRRDVATALYCGAATTQGRGLHTHVWLQDGAYGVVGEKEAHGFTLLARYSVVDK